MRPKAWIVLSGAIICIAFAFWLTLSLRDGDSTLNVGARYLKETLCLSAESNTTCVLKAMAKYEKKGRYDEAIHTGATWADRYPDNVTSGWVYVDISTLYLKKSRIDSGRAKDYLNQAALYRDKALLSLGDSPYSLQPLVAISEAVGDLSGSQRCTQYGNAIKLLNRMNILATEEKDRLSRQFKPDLTERKKVESLLEWIDTEVGRVHQKLAASGCDKESQSAG